MKNIRKSLWFQAKIDIFTLTITVLVLLITAAIVFLNDNFKTMTGGMAFAGSSEFLPVIVFYYICLVTPRICGGDLKDKTLNARVIVTFEITLSVMIISTAIPVGITTLLHGFGANMTITELFILFGMFLCTSIRLIAECILITFLAGEALYRGSYDASGNVF